MSNKNQDIYLEKVSHITESMPYSLHKINFSKKYSQALYLHIHPEMEFFYLESGKLDFFIKDEKYSMSAGDAIFIPPSLLHHATCSSDKGIFHAIVFSPNFIISPLEDDIFQKYIPVIMQGNPSFVYHLKKENKKHRNILLRLEEIFSTSSDKKDLYLYFHGLMLLIWHDLYNLHISSKKQDKSYNNYSQLKPALQYIHEHFGEDISLTELANSVNMSSAYFCRLFKKMTSYTPFSYLKRYRIIKSCSYLSNSDKKISEICSLCGFNNISYYNREFLKTIQTTPSQYRKNNQ